jgi:hypothetical protein
MFSLAVGSFTCLNCPEVFSTHVNPQRHQTALPALGAT